MQNIAITHSIAHSIQALEYVQSQSKRHPKMLLLTGAPGTGKTITLEYLESEYQSVYYAATPGLTLTALANELLEAITGEASHFRFTRAKRELFEIAKSKQVPIAIDEAGFLNFNCLEFLRSLHDACDIPVIFGGMSDLYTRLIQHPQLLDRMICIPFKKCDFTDAKFLATAITKVTVTEDLLRDCHHKLDGNIRRISAVIASFEERAIELGISEISLKDWGNQAYTSSYHQPPIKSRK